VRAGFVSDEDLGNVYEHAVALVQPSYYEGFGFPVLEAMTFHTPVITSNTSSLGEIAGPSIQIDPNNYQSITDAMNNVSLMTAADKKKLLDIQNNWVKNYTWQKVADDTIHTYEKVLGKI
jgi:glycosyltransferase involved in cell wall biosynthesis